MVELGVSMGTDVKRSANALVDDPDWCGHWCVSLRTWTCADCHRPVTAETRRRLEHAPTAAPSGSVWILSRAIQDDTDCPTTDHCTVGLFTDRAQIARLLVRGAIVDADDIRDALRRAHWYQGAFNTMLFEGWDEEPDDRGTCHFYRLELEAIDHP